MTLASGSGFRRWHAINPRGWTLLILCMMIFSAVGIGLGPGYQQEGYVLVFLASVAGTVATSMAFSLNSAMAGHRGPLAAPGAANPRPPE